MKYCSPPGDGTGRGDWAGRGLVTGVCWLWPGVWGLCGWCMPPGLAICAGDIIGLGCGLVTNGDGDITCWQCGLASGPPDGRRICCGLGVRAPPGCGARSGGRTMAIGGRGPPGNRCSSTGWSRAS